MRAVALQPSKESYRRSGDMHWLLLTESLLIWCTVRAEDCPIPCACFVNADEERTLTVDCRNQELQDIPLGIPPTTSHLDVSYNHIQYVRGIDLEDLPVLTYLRLQVNDITDIEEGTFEALPSLETLNLENNLLQRLRPGTFSGLDNLQSLNLFNNYLGELDPVVFSPLQNLVYLNLAYNSLEFITRGTFFNLSRLFDLNLSENFISIIERASIGNLPFLRTLYCFPPSLSPPPSPLPLYICIFAISCFRNLEGNQLQYVPTDAWVNVPRLHSVLVDRNPVECGCRALWLRMWLLERSPRRPVFCRTPANLQGMDLLRLTPDDFCRLPTATIMEADPVVLAEGMTLQLTCVTSGAPPPVTMWSREGMTFNLMNERLEIEGNSLTVTDVIVSDSGRYICSSSSSAGTTAGSIDVVVVRTENVRTENVTIDNMTIPMTIRIPVTIPITNATVGDTAVLQCDDDLPVTVMTTWIFSPTPLNMNISTPVNFTGRFAMGERGELIVFDVQAEDMGRYECVLADGVSLFRDLLLQAIPHITITPERPCETPDSLSVTTGESLRLTCTATGVPTPDVTWSTPDRGTVSGVGSAVVSLVPPLLEDTGQYVCTAVNDIGTDVSAVNISVTAVLGLNQTIFSSQQFLVGQTAILNCSFPGMSTIELEWRRTDGRPFPVNSVQTSDGTLILPQLTLDDIAVYRCQAVLAQGQIAFLERGVVVFEPASIIGGYPLPEVRVAIENTTVTLNCSIRGNIRPSLEWRFGNDTVVEGGGIEFTRRTLGPNSRDEVLVISLVNQNDTGIYTCNTSNPVGTEIYSYFLDVRALSEVTTAPFFRQQPPPETDVIVRGTARLHCQAAGSSPITISWFMTPIESNMPVTQIFANERIVLSPEELVIFDVRPSDEGFYFCTAVNDKGKRTSVMGQVNVWTPPEIVEGLPIDYLAVEGTESIVIPCSGTGDPEPDLNWLRDSAVLPLSTKQRILPDGSLEIFHLTPEDAGEYMCRLANAAGEDYRTVTLFIRAVPRAEIVPSEPSPLDIGSQLTLFCSDMGTRPEPLETLQWRRDGDPLKTEENVVVFPDTGELILSDLQISDSGNYTCEISSYAGSSEASVQIIVVDPFFGSGAMITPLSVSTPTSRNQFLGEGQTAQFVCVTSPPPPPITIVWFKDGSPLRNLKRISIDEVTGGLVTIINTRITDEGVYTCTASNRLGEVRSLSFNLTISTRPIFTWPPESQVITVGDILELRCKATGKPEPQILWLHNGTLLTTEDCITINETTNGLTVCNTTASSAGWYSCFAQNIAGTAEFTVSVIVTPEPPVAPNITSRPATRILMAGEPLILDCIAAGRPQPTVTWFKDGEVLNTTCEGGIFPGECLLVDESVYIQDTRITDSGTYTCVAENSAGVSVYEVDLLVEAASILPTFSVFPRVVNASSQLVVVECQADGDPPPLLSWLNNDFEIISTNSTERIYSDVRGVLYFTMPTPDDNGQYICRAENTAGINQVAVRIWVVEEEEQEEDGANNTTIRLDPDNDQGTKFLVAPHNVVTYEGLPVVVPCSVAKTTNNSFTLWRKNKQPLYQDNAVTITTNGSLVIQRSKVENSGDYDCVAVSELGIVMATISIQVLARLGPPEFVMSPSDLRVTSGTDVVLPCQPHRPTNENLSLTWLKDGRPLLEVCEEREVREDGSLHIMGVTPTDAGIYTCRLGNQQATVDAMATLTVTDYPITTTLRVSDGGMLIVIQCALEEVSSTDIQWSRGSLPLSQSPLLIPFGHQLLFQSVNPDLGGEYTCSYNQQRSSSFLEVLVHPDIVNHTLCIETDDPDKAVILQCIAIGNPTPRVTWYLADMPVLRGVAATPLQDGSLYLHPPLPIGTVLYTCEAKNEVGTDTADIILSVSP